MPEQPKDPQDVLVTVCAACKRASCWQGEHFCDQESDTVQMWRSELLLLSLEHERYLKSDDELLCESL